MATYSFRVAVAIEMKQMPMDKMPIEELMEDVRIIVRELRSNPTNSSEDVACRAIHGLYCTYVTRLLESNSKLEADITFLQRHIIAENEAAKTIIDRLKNELQQLVNADQGARHGDS